MEKNGDTIPLNVPGPNGGVLVLVSDYVNKRVSLIEIIPKAVNTRKIVVWEVQDYTQTGG
jgi:hypothetical protein